MTMTIEENAKTLNAEEARTAIAQLAKTIDSMGYTPPEALQLRQRQAAELLNSIAKALNLRLPEENQRARGHRIAEFVAEVLEVGKAVRGASGTFADLLLKNTMDRPIVTLPVSAATSVELGRRLYQNVYIAIEIPPGNAAEEEAPAEPGSAADAKATPEEASLRSKQMIAAANLPPPLAVLASEFVMEFFRDAAIRFFRTTSAAAGAPEDYRRCWRTTKDVLAYLLRVSP